MRIKNNLIILMSVKILNIYIKIERMFLTKQFIILLFIQLPNNFLFNFSQKFSKSSFLLQSYFIILLS